MASAHVLRIAPGAEDDAQPPSALFCDAIVAFSAVNLRASDEDPDDEDVTVAVQSASFVGLPPSPDDSTSPDQGDAVSVESAAPEEQLGALHTTVINAIANSASLEELRGD